MQNNRIRVYIASPYTSGDKEENVKLQLNITDALLDLGYAPYTPLLTHYLNQNNCRPSRDWLDLDLQYLPLCHAVLRIKPIKDGIEIPSSGADEEEHLAKEEDIPVFYDIPSLHEYFTIIGYPKFRFLS